MKHRHSSAEKELRFAALLVKDLYHTLQSKGSRIGNESTNRAVSAIEEAINMIRRNSGDRPINIRRVKAPENLDIWTGVNHT